MGFHSIVWNRQGSGRNRGVGFVVGSLLSGCWFWLMAHQLVFSNFEGLALRRPSISAAFILTMVVVSRMIEKAVQHRFLEGLNLWKGIRNK